MMSNFTKTLEANVQKDEEARKRRAILVNFTKNPQVTLEDLFNVCENSQLAPLMKTISIEEIWSVSPHTAAEEEEEEEEEEEVAAAPRRAKKRAKKTGRKAKKTGRKAKTKKTTKKRGKKKAPTRKTKAKSSTTKNGASKKGRGGRKPRQDYDHLSKEVVAYMKKAGEPQSTGDLQKKFGISGSQARKVFEILTGQKKVKHIGKGGRGSKYELR